MPTSFLANLFAWSNRDKLHLPKTRKYRLTPTPPHEDVATLGRSTQNCPLYCKLPTEIRLQILRAAFGDGVVHMDIVVGLRPATKSGEAIVGHAGGAPVVHSSKSELPMGSFGGSSSRETQHWRGSVCHRNPPGTIASGHSVQPSEDRCRFGQTPDDTCALWPGDSRNKCFIGAMGWLLSCRQA